jgi:chemotaxis protein methyltransferase CheR
MTAVDTSLRPDFLSDADYKRLADYIHATAGIKLPPAKKGMLEGRLRRCVRRLGLQSLDEYCRYLFEDGGLADESTTLIDAITTNKTDFFREPHHFQFLLDEALPRLYSEGFGAARPLRIWSAGCSTGAEPYTIAMVCAAFGQQVGRFRTEILATDICTDVLREAVRGIYPHDMIEPVPMEMRRRYLLRSHDRQRNLVRIAPELRATVQFARLNLMDRDYPVDEPMEVIFCRNLLIYFDRPTQQAVLTRLCRHLRPGGHLILGHSESIAGYELPVRPIRNTIFLREDSPWKRSAS